MSFNAREHNALKGRVQRTEQDVGKLEGETGMAKNVIDTMRERDAAMAHQQSEKDREWRQEIREAAKWENEANAKKMEADAMEQERDEWKAKCETMVAQKEVLLATIAERQRDNAVLEAQLKHKKEDAAELARARREVKAVEQRENDRKEREAKDRRKSAEAAKEVAAEARAKTMAAELERDTVRRENDGLVIRVKALEEVEARVHAADAKRAESDAQYEALAAKLKAETRAKDAAADAEARASTELEKVKIALRQAHDQQSKVSGVADELRGRCVKLEADLVAARAELKARDHERLRRSRRQAVPRAVPQLEAHLPAHGRALARQGARAYERVAGAGVRGRDGEVAPLRAARQEGRAGQGAPRCQVQGLGNGRRREADGVARRPPRVSLYASRAATVCAVIPHLLKSHS